MKFNFTIVILFSLALAGSVFMVSESAGYYSMVYSVDQSYIAWAAAILSEVFQHSLIILPGETKRQDWWFKRLALVIFFLTVIAAGYNIYKPFMKSIEQSKRETRLVQVLEQEIDDNKADQHSFLTGENRQKVNAALSVNERRKSSGELKEILKKPVEDESMLSPFEIIHMFLLRIAIQTTALAFAWKLGMILKRKSETVEQKPREVLKRWRVKHLRSEQGFAGIVQFNDETYMSVTPNRRKSYKTWHGALQFFKGTKYEGKIPLEPTTSVR